MTGPVEVRTVPTPSGPARLHVVGPPATGEPAAARLVLGHGAGGGVDAPDLVAAAAAGRDAGLEVVLVEQPWRVRGARVAEAPPRLDAALRACLAALPPLPVVLGGRSAGARVSCRLAADPTLPGPTVVVGVLCLAFPLVPPGRTASRAAELALPRVPRLVVQGARDPFGVPEPAPGVEVHVVAGADHALRVRRADGRTAGQVHQEVREVVARWLARLAQTLT